MRETLEERIIRLFNLQQLQGEEGNWNCDPYTFGVYQGLALATGIMKDEDPDFRNRPEKWLHAEESE